MPKAPVSVELNAAISPRDVGKQSPSSLPQAPNIVFPAFEPRLIKLPGTPAAPAAPSIKVLEPVDIIFQVGGFGQSQVVTMSNISQGVAAQNYSKYEVQGTSGINIGVSSSGYSITGDTMDLSHGGTTANMAAGYTQGGATNAFISHVQDYNSEVLGKYNLHSTKPVFKI